MVAGRRRDPLPIHAGSSILEWMRRVTIRRRADGIVQIRPRPLWRAIAGPVPAAMLGLLLACALGMGVLAAALVHFPALVLLVGGSVALLLVAVRWGLTEPRLADAETGRRPPGQAA